MERLIYRLHDHDAKLKEQGAIKTSIEEAREFNKLGWGIFWTVSSFRGSRRLDQLEEVYFYFVETDNGSKASIERLIAKGLLPSLVVESKRGFHIYWRCASQPTRLEYKSINERLIHFFGGDKGVKDETRLLRFPGFYHMKDPKYPFLVKKVFESELSYSPQAMMYFFKLPKKKEIHIQKLEETRVAISTHSNSSDWEYFNNLNCFDALTRLSGTDAVSGEIYTFVKNPLGTLQIIVNNKRSQNWIDANGKIGSHSGGGPTIFQWIKWFGRSNREVVEILKKYFSEGFTSGN